VQDASARAEIRRIFWVFWCSQADPLDQFLLCRHIVANAFHVPQTSTICRKRAVIKSVLWLCSNGSLVAEIWPFQVGGVGYVHVCACRCRYMHICACIYRYVSVCVGMYLATCGIYSIISSIWSALMAQPRWYIVSIVHLTTGVRAPEQSKPFCCDLHVFCRVDFSAMRPQHCMCITFYAQLRT
jgi:hypothetical protein